MLTSARARLVVNPWTVAAEYQQRLGPWASDRPVVAGQTLGFRIADRVFAAHSLPTVRQWRRLRLVVERWLTVVETRSYQARAAKLMTREEQDRVVEMIARDPTCGVVMKEMGGIRKVRVAIGGRGKSGGVRVVFYYHSDIMPVFLLALFAKNEKDNLSKSERNILAALVGDLARPFKR